MKWESTVCAMSAIFLSQIQSWGVVIRRRVATASSVDLEKIQVHLVHLTSIFSGWGPT